MAASNTAQTAASSIARVKRITLGQVPGRRVAERTVRGGLGFPVADVLG